MSKIKIVIICVIIVLGACGVGHPTSNTDGNVSVADGAPFTKGVSTLAGVADPGFVDGDRNAARFNNPVNVAYGPDGMVYVADFDNNKIRAVDANGRVTTIVAQNGFMRPFGLAFASDGTLFISTDNDQNGAHDPMSGSVWRVNLGATTATIVANAIGRPRGIAMLGDGRLALSDDEHAVVRLLDPSTGTLLDLAGTWDTVGYADAIGPAARFATPYAIALRGDGTLVVADQGNNRIRVVALDGSVTTLAGSTAGYVDATLAHSQFDHPQAIIVAANGDIYVTDLDNFRVRRLRGDSVTTLVGDGIGGYKDADDPLAAEVFGIEGIALSADGQTLCIADGNRGNPVPFNRVRVVDLAP